MAYPSVSDSAFGITEMVRILFFLSKALQDFKSPGDSPDVTDRRSVKKSVGTNQYSSLMAWNWLFYLLPRVVQSPSFIARDQVHSCLNADCRIFLSPLYPGSPRAPERRYLGASDSQPAAQSVIDPFKSIVLSFIWTFSNVRPFDQKTQIGNRKVTK